MTKLYSYVVDHDRGYAPNPSDGYCTLVQCKFATGKKRNIVELAQVGDWIVGTGGADLKRSAGHSKIVFAMQVTEKISLSQYLQDSRFQKRWDTDSRENEAARFALISDNYYYFGRKAINVDGMPTEHLSRSFEKKGPGYINSFNAEFIEDFAHWLQENYKMGINGSPCVVSENDCECKEKCDCEKD
jgi:hypothetical protein